MAGKNLTDIQFEGTNEDVVWRSPVTDFESGSRLTVYESQEALFYLNGQCVGVLDAGSHMLDTGSLPFLKSLFYKVTGRQNIFHAQIYFVNRVELDIKWGVPDILYEDPAGPVFTVGCFGQLNLRSESSRRIVEKLVGTQTSLTKKQLSDRFEGLLSAEVKDRLVNVMLEKQISITQVSAQQRAVSEALTPILKELYGKYGFSLEQFRIIGVRVPEEDPEYKRMKRLKANQGMMMSELQLERQAALMRQQTEADKIQMEAQAMAYKRQIEGYSYETEKRFDFLNTMASRESSPNTERNWNRMQDEMMTEMMRDMAAPNRDRNVGNASQTENARAGAGKFCMECGTPLPAAAKFCPNCGQKQDI